jgi:hypothetical protein
MPRFLTITVLTASALLVASHEVGRAAPAALSENMYGCPATADPYLGLTFNDAEHHLWYRRFWTGACTSLPFLSCFPGVPYWEQTVEQLVAELSPDLRNAAREKACRLGKMVGYEWAKDNRIRKIDTAQLRVWIDQLQHPPDLDLTLDKIEREAKGLGAVDPDPTHRPPR